MKKFILAVLFALSMTACEHIPGGSTIGLQIGIGSGGSPTFKQAQDWRDANQTDMSNVLINGIPVNRADWPAVVRIIVGNAACTATVVGPRTIVTAAHCGETGQIATFQTVTGGKFSAVLQREPLYPGKDVDVNVGTTTVDIDVKPMSVKTDMFEREGMTVTLMGYGCTMPGGGGGNDGVLRTNTAKVETKQAGDDWGYDLWLSDPATGAALCYGDSGGPVLWKDTLGNWFVIGINSKGNIKDRSFCTRLTLPDAAGFLKAFNAQICGANSTCGLVVPTPPPAPPVPAPYTFSFDKAFSDKKQLHLEGYLK